MNYEEKYNTALQRAKERYSACSASALLEYIFPELRENEDERIRKAIICGMYTLKENQKKKTFADIPLDDCITWLEKQGEQKPVDKVEPKFKVDDWIVFNGLILHIDEAINGYYRTTSIGYGIHNSYDWDIDNIASLWTIQDAKDGDILATWAGAFIYNGNNDGSSCPGSYCGINTLGRFQIGGEKHWTGKKVYPATKEQRDLLFQKMADAGWEWDVEKKELKKIESKKLDSDKVISWVKNTFPTPDMLIDKFKKDFSL